MNPDFFETIKFIGFVLGGITLWFKDTIAIKLGIKQGEKNLEKNALDNLQKQLEVLQKHLEIYNQMITDIDLKHKNRISDLEESFNISIIKLQKDIEELEKLNLKLSEIINTQNLKIKYYTEKFGDQINKEK